jgi:hypothetical protein
MILPYKITLDELSKIDKNYKWPKHYCECCHRNMWGHGCVPRYFSEIPTPVFLKRYRCPGCRALVVVRPEGYWSRIRSSILCIYLALKAKLSTSQWPSLFSRQRGNYWLKKFVRFAMMETELNLSAFLDRCHLKQVRFLP